METGSIQVVAVLGLGTMGHGIAQSFALAGYRVHGYDELPAACETLLDRVRSNLRQLTEAGLLKAEAMDRALERLIVVDSETEAVGPAQFVTEAVSEDLEVKRELFARLETVVGPETILASNSSSFPITETSLRMQHPERAVVTHWFNPPHIVPVVEVVPGKLTSERTVQTTCELLQRIGKWPVPLKKEIPGFLVNRVQMAMFREVWDLLERGIASAEEIDRAIRGSMGFRLAALGPLEVNDFAGLDISAKVYENLIGDMRSDAELPTIIRELIEQGHHGVKSGRGVYEYTPESIEKKRTQRDHQYLALVKLLQEWFKRPTS